MAQIPAGKSHENRPQYYPKSQAVVQDNIIYHTPLLIVHCKHTLQNSNFVLPLSQQLQVYVLLRPSIPGHPLVETWGKSNGPTRVIEWNIYVEDTQVPVQSASHEPKLPRASGHRSCGRDMYRFVSGVKDASMVHMVWREA